MAPGLYRAALLRRAADDPEGKVSSNLSIDALRSIARDPPGTIWEPSTPTWPSSNAFTPPAKRRDRLWELSPNLHCSIVGTCLSTSDLRSLLAKLGDGKARTASEHDLHGQAVGRAGRRDDGGKLLHKLLDRRHDGAIARFARAETVDAVRTLWREAVAKGDIPGAYWAVLTHPFTDQTLVKEAFGEVHMLSHLVGRSVRSDLRRLPELEAELQLHEETIAALEARIAALTRDKVEAERRRSAQAHDLLVARSEPRRWEEDTCQATSIVRLREQLDRAKAKAAAEEERRIEAERIAHRLAGELRDGALREAALRAELDRLDAAFEVAEDDVNDASLAGRTLLYVGGRPRQVAQARLAMGRRGAEFLTHDGGIEDAPTLLPGLVSRADTVLFPVDCVSHDAVATLKRHCRDHGRTLLPLRSASLASLLAALRQIGARPEAV